MPAQPVLPCLLPSPHRRSSGSRARSPTFQHEPDGRREQPRPLLRQGLQGKTGRGSAPRGAWWRGCPVRRPRPPVPKPTAESASPLRSPLIHHLAKFSIPARLPPPPGVWSRLPAGCWGRDGSGWSSGWLSVPPSRGDTFGRVLDRALRVLRPLSIQCWKGRNSCTCYERDKRL